jgi:CubicO group peptidase (beta-lactamase class C family)
MFLAPRACCFALLLPLAPAARAQPIDAAVDAVIRDGMKAWQVPGAAVAIVKDQEVVYLKGHGVRAAGGKEAVTPDTLFAIASSTKPFTTTAIAMLADDGKLSWDDPVRKHVEFFRLADPLADAQVTLRDLATHRTGLVGHPFLWYGSPWDREEAIRRLGRVPLDKPFRSSFQYQNLTYITAGVAAGRADKSTWEELVQKRIFDPLGMSGANFSIRQAAKVADRATPHVRKSGKVEAIDWVNFDTNGPAGSINATLRDMSQWVRFQLGDGTFGGKRLLSARRFAELHSPQVVIPLVEGSELSPEANPESNMMSYGLGWFVQDYRGRLLVHHGGNIDGWRCQVYLLPKAKIGLAVLSNLGDTRFPEAVGNGLLDHLLAAPERDWNELLIGLDKTGEAAVAARLKKREAERHVGTRPSRDLVSYAGDYEHPAYGTAAVSLEGDRLVVTWTSHKIRLEHHHFDTFALRGDRAFDHQLLTFHLGSDGEVGSMTFLDYPPQEFKRVRPQAGAKK